MGDMEKLEQEWKEVCKEISEQCVEEGYPSHGSNYEIRVEAMKEYYPELFGEQ